MIFPGHNKQHNVLFIGGDFIQNTIPPKLNTNLIATPFDRRTFTINGRPVREILTSQNIDAALIIPQPEVEEICNSDWLNHIANQIPVGIIWYDYVVYRDVVDRMKGFFHFILDEQNQNTNNTTSLWTPIKGEVREPQEDREIGVGFYGRIDCDQRKDAIRYLLNRGVPVFTTGTEWSTVSFPVMYQYMRTSKIILNFANTRFHPVQHTQQLKGRVLEAMVSGALVVENSNNQSNLYFQPGKDLIWFDTHEELYEKVKFYLDNDKERIRIAGNGQYLCVHKYNIENWWGKLLPKLLNFKKQVIKL